MTRRPEELRRIAVSEATASLASESLEGSPRPRESRFATRRPDASFATGPGWRLYVPSTNLGVELERCARWLETQVSGLVCDITGNDSGLRIRFDGSVAEGLHAWLTSDEYLPFSPTIRDRIWLPDGETLHQINVRLRLPQGERRYIMSIDSEDDESYACWPLAVPLVANLAAFLEMAAAGPDLGPDCDRWPNHPSWSALREGLVTIDDERWILSVVKCGELHMSTGMLVVCDPFVAMSRTRNCVIRTAVGRFPVYVTLASNSTETREAYATILLGKKPEAYRRGLALLHPSEPAPSLEYDEFIGFRVDSGTACFVDAGSLHQGMPVDEGTWQNDLFENESPNSWFNLMDSPAHLRPGLANIRLPLAADANLVLFHSGWGDGNYPVVGGYSQDGTLVSVHIDFWLFA